MRPDSDVNKTKTNIARLVAARGTTSALPQSLHGKERPRRNIALPNGIVFPQRGQPPLLDFIWFWVMSAIHQKAGASAMDENNIASWIA